MRSLAIAACALSLGLLGGTSCRAPSPAPLASRLAQGRELCLAHRWPAAIAVLSEVLADAPDDPEALRWRGHAHTGAGDHDRALADLERALALGADDAWTHYALAMARHHRGELERAVAGYTTALQRDPGFTKALEWRGFTRSLLGDQAGAIADLDAAIAGTRGHAWLYFVRAKAHAARLDFDRAEQDLWQALDHDDENADAHAQLGYLKACLGESRAAIAQFERALALDPAAQIEARLWLFHLHTAAGATAAARTEVETVRAAAPAPAHEWPRQQARFLLGELRFDELLAVAAGPAPAAAANADRRCAAFLHAGLLHAQAGRTEPARTALASAVATDARDQWEWSLARRELRRLDDGDRPAK